MLKELIPITKPTTLKIAKGVKRDLEEKGCKVYITSILVDRGRKYKTKLHEVWREPDEEDRENELQTEEVDIPKEKA